MSKDFLTYEQQLNKLQKEKKFIIDIDEKKALNNLKKWNYTKLFSVYKELFVDYPVERKEIFFSNDEITIKSILQNLKTKFEDNDWKHKYTSKKKFSILENLKINNDKISLIIFEKIKDIEEKMKTRIAYFIGREKEQLEWFIWLSNLQENDERKKFKKRFLKKGKELKKVPIWHAINSMDMGQLNTIIHIIINASDQKISYNLKKIFVKKFLQMVWIKTLQLIKKLKKLILKI